MMCREAEQAVSALPPREQHVFSLTSGYGGGEMETSPVRMITIRFGEDEELILTDPKLSTIAEVRKTVLVLGQEREMSVTFDPPIPVRPTLKEVRPVVGADGRLRLHANVCGMVIEPEVDPQEAREFARALEEAADEAEAAQATGQG